MDEFGDEREGVFVWDCPLVEISVVLNRSELAIFLLYEKEPAGIGRVGPTNSTQSEILLDEFLLFLLFFGG